MKILSKLLELIRGKFFHFDSGRKSLPFLFVHALVDVDLSVATVVGIEKIEMRKQSRVSRLQIKV